VQPKQARRGTLWVAALPGEESFRRLARRSDNDENRAVGQAARLPTASYLLLSASCLLLSASCLLFSVLSFE